jgi:hypothetical protein
MTMRAKRLCLALGVPLALALLVLLIPFSRDVVVGWACGEAFFQGRPTHYWEEAVKEGWDRWVRQRRVGEPYSPPTWLDRLREWLGQEDDSPAVLEATEGAVPVLVELLQSQDADVRRSAALALSSAHARPDLVVPALVRAQQDEDPTVRWAAGLSLGAHDP